MEELVNKISKTNYEKLIDAGINSPKEILLLNCVELQEKAGVSSEDAKDILEKIANILLSNKVKKATDIPAWSRLTSGCESIDLITNGGFPVHGLTELFGSAGVGKTQLCLQAALTVQLPINKGGLSRGAVYISTEYTFPAKRLQLLCKHFHKRHNMPESLNLMDNFYINHSADFEQLKKCICGMLPNLLSENRVGLIILDSIAGAFRSENEDCDYEARSQEFYLLAMKLQDFARKYNLAVICTNQVTDDVDTGETVPALGHAWKNLVTCRFKVARNSRESLVRVFEVVNSPDLPPRDCNFIIKEDGIDSY